MENPACAEHLPKETPLFHLVPLTYSKSRCFRVTFWMCFKRPASSWRKAWTASPNFPSSCWLVHNFGQDLRKTRAPRGLGSQDRVAAGLIHQKHGTPYVYIWGGYIWHYGEGIDYPKKTSTRTRTMKTYYWISDAIPTSCLARRARIRSHASFVRPSIWPQTKSQQGVDCMKNKIKELKKTPK